MGKILIQNLIFCSEYEEAKNISKVYEDFSFRWLDFGENKKVKARRHIKKLTSDKYCVIIYYNLTYKGIFEEYGFVDEWTKKKFPQIIEDIRHAEEKWRVICKYQDKIEDYRDIYYYDNFERYLNDCLCDYLEKIYMMGEIAFLGKYDTGEFIIYFDTYEGEFKTGRSFRKIENLRVSVDNLFENKSAYYTKALQIWNWMDENYYCKEEDEYSEARVITAYSYVLNRTPFEVLLYAVIGLENALTDGKNGIKSQLKEILPKLYDFISSEDVKELYRMRSEFVHGDIEFPNFYKRGITEYREFKYIKYARMAKLALVLTINELVRNDATKIRLINDQIEYSKEKTLREACAEWQNN